ncbi:hypothetical protein MAHJHV28_46880 [Mycobacterium avium subsp. hominissuis]
MFEPLARPVHPLLAADRRQEWMDRPSYRFEHLLSFAYNGLVSDASGGCTG